MESKKAIVILGSSGVGKTYAFKTAFKLGQYGCKSAITKNIASANGYQFLPEVQGGIHKSHSKELNSFLLNGNITIADVNPRFKVLIPILENLQFDIKYLLLDTDDETIEKNIRSRRTRATTDIDKAVAMSLNDQRKLRMKGYKTITQDLLIRTLESKL